jgi:hypothetical protein
LAKEYPCRAAGQSRAMRFAYARLTGDGSPYLLRTETRRR